MGDFLAEIQVEETPEYLEWLEAHFEEEDEE